MDWASRLGCGKNKWETWVSWRVCFLAFYQDAKIVEKNSFKKNRRMIRVWDRIWCGLCHTDSTKVTRLLAASTPSFLVRKPVTHLSLWRDNSACLTFLVPWVLRWEPQDLCASWRQLSQCSSQSLLSRTWDSNHISKKDSDEREWEG